MTTSKSFLTAWLCLLSAGCVSFKIPVLYPFENQVEYISVSRGIDDSGDLLEGLDSGTEFDLSEEKLYCLLRMKDIAQAIRLQWRWYGPDKGLVRETVEITVNEEEKYLEIMTAYDEIDLRDRDNAAGRWTVVILLNGEVIGSRNFLIKNRISAKKG